LVEDLDLKALGFEGADPAAIARPSYYPVGRQAGGVGVLAQERVASRERSVPLSKRRSLDRSGPGQAEELRHVRFHRWDDVSAGDEPQMVRLRAARGSYFQLFNALAAKISLGPTDMAREIVRFYSSFARLEMPPNRCNPHDGGCTQR